MVVWWCFRDGGGAVFLFGGVVVSFWCRCLCGGIFVVVFLR